MLRNLLGLDKTMVACHELKTLKDSVMLGKMKAFKDHKLKASACATKQVGKVDE